MANIIEFDNVSYYYEDAKTPALSNLSLSIKKGECVAIIGENGSGKTTMIKHINGLLKPVSGSVQVDGEYTTKKTIAELSKKVGFVFQNPDHMIFADTIEEEVSFGPKNLGMDVKKIPENVDNVLAFTRLTKYKKEHPMSLSGGEKQRLAIASIIISEPEILILDEPTTGLDYHSVESMISLIGKLKKKNTTILLITHDMNLVTKMTDRIIVLKKGTVIADGPPNKIFSDQKVLDSSRLEIPYALKLSKVWGLESCITHEEIYEAMRVKMK